MHAFVLSVTPSTNDQSDIVTSSLEIFENKVQCVSLSSSQTKCCISDNAVAQNRILNTADLLFI